MPKETAGPARDAGVGAQAQHHRAAIDAELVDGVVDRRSRRPLQNVGFEARDFERLLLGRGRRKWRAERRQRCGTRKGAVVDS